MPILGSNSMTRVTTKRGYRRDIGDTRIEVWEGPKSAAEAFYIEKRSDTTIDDVDIEIRNGKGIITITIVDQVDGIDTVLPDDNDIWEVVPQDINRAIESHPYFAALDATMTKHLSHVRRVVEGDESLLEVEPHDQGIPYYNLLQRGNAEYFSTAVILRRTLKVGSRSTLKASWADVDKAVSFPMSGSGGGRDIIGMVSEIPGFDSGRKQWLKRAPSVTKTGRGRFQITQEWWFALSWSKYLYDGGGEDMNEDTAP